MVQELLQALDAVEDLDEARVVVVKRAEDRGALQFVKFRELLIGARRPAAVSNVQAGQRSDAVGAVGETLGLVVSDFR
jgi:hypothetical protein